MYGRTALRVVTPKQKVEKLDKTNAEVQRMFTQHNKYAQRLKCARTRECAFRWMLPEINSESASNVNVSPPKEQLTSSLVNMSGGSDGVSGAWDDLNFTETYFHQSTYF